MVRWSMSKITCGVLWSIIFMILVFVKVPPDYFEWKKCMAPNFIPEQLGCRLIKYCLKKNKEGYCTEVVYHRRQIGKNKETNPGS